MLLFLDDLHNLATASLQFEALPINLLHCTCTVNCYSSTDSKIEIKLVNEKSREVEVTNVKSIIVQNCYDVS